MTLSAALLAAAVQFPPWMVHEIHAANAMEPEARPACYQVNVSRGTYAHVCITKAQWCRIHVARGEFPHDECKVEPIYARCCG